jgi:uncharacterized protein YPO0396
MDNNALPLDLAPPEDGPAPGFRLARLELYNWGTFDGRVWTLRLDGDNALLTGGNGAGKSTVVDAITTLLVPPTRVQYNKAAGADEAERSLRSYVLGHFKSERNEATGGGKAAQLRESTSYSVLLAVFRAADLRQTVTLAQVFWIKDGVNVPQRFYACAERDLTIAGDFAGFGQDITTLRKRLRAAEVVIEDSFARYSQWFCRRIGIETGQPLELFNQAVSMKSVGNLTGFVRERMLPPFQARERIEALITHFDDLNRSHEAVLKAKRQVELLTPLVAACDRHLDAAAEAGDLRGCRDALHLHFARHRHALLAERVARLEQELAKAEGTVRRHDERYAEAQRRIVTLREAIAASGGDRLARLAEEIARQRQTGDDRRRAADRLAAALAALEETLPADEEAFAGLRARLESLRTLLEARKAEAQNALVEAGFRLRERQQEYASVEAELQGLRRRRSNIDQWHVGLRQRLCAAIGCEDEDSMPFAGELVQVREEAREWEGAAERLLRGLGLSMLVPDPLYPKVSRWINEQRLGGRFVYYRVLPGRAVSVSDLSVEALARKLVVKPDSPFHDWLQARIEREADFVCCRTLEDFQRERRAITRQGQVKDPGGRHEKDDRYAIDDRSRYVLGWTNAAKIAALEARLRTLSGQAAALVGDVAAAEQTVKALDRQADALARASVVGEFRELDWQSPAREVATLEAECERIRSASDTLAELSTRLERELRALADLEAERDVARDQRARVGTRREDSLEQLAAVAAEIAAAPAADAPESTSAAAALDARLDAMRAEAFPEAGRLTVEGCAGAEQAVRNWLQARIDAVDKRVKLLRDQITRDMKAFQDEYPLDTAEFDASVEAEREYRGFLERLGRDDLPRFEAKFKELLNVNTINEIATFSAQLKREQLEIRERIERINDSLRPIAYNPERYIKLLLEPTRDPEVRQFQQDLKACTEGALTGSDDSQYSEAKFLQVKAIIDRFKGRDGSAELDRAWTAKVTDVRHWFLFAVSERWRADDQEHEYYADSAGKSGGQKEKLAYTILAAGLAYQFGLKASAGGARSFRFVTIDEAFGRATEESAQYGLTLFRQLGLQLLVVTPLEKIHVIEPYVASVGYMQNPTGRDSQLLNLSIAEFRQRRAEFAA